MKASYCSTPRRGKWLGGRFASVRAFTMLELLIVVGIMMLILLMGLPAIRGALKKEAFVQGMNDVLDACDFARSQAIMNDAYMEMRIYPQSHMIEVAAIPRDTALSPITSDGSSDSSDPDKPPPPGPKSFSRQMPEQIIIEMLDVNFAEYKDADVARVRFYPNGTSSRFTMGIHSTDSGDFRLISLEEVTALTEVTDLHP